MENYKIFPILNKFDRIWSSNPSKTFCQIYTEITKEVKINDEEFSKLLTEYIENNKIK